MCHASLGELWLLMLCNVNHHKIANKKTAWVKGGFFRSLN